jgi:hypothetical protein
MIRACPWSILLVVALGLPGAALAQIPDQIETRDGVRYACTGVGLDAREDPRWRDFPLRLEFAAAHGGYIAGVDVQIRRADGGIVLGVRCDTPWLVVDLPPGSYGVSATALGEHSRTATVQLAAGRQTRAVLRYPEIVAQ